VLALDVKIPSMPHQIISSPTISHPSNQYSNHTLKDTEVYAPEWALSIHTNHSGCVSQLGSPVKYSGIKNLTEYLFIFVPQIVSTAVCVAGVVFAATSIKLSNDKNRLLFKSGYTPS
jgi:hypothetical protein